MFKINIISKVEMAPISQEVIEKMLVEQIKAQDPRVHVNGITFVQRRDPARIEAIVDAQLGEPTAEQAFAPTQVEVSPEDTTESIKASEPEKPKEPLFDAPKAEVKADPAQSVASLFE